MKEQQVLKNNVREYYLVKVNDLFVSGTVIGRNYPVKLNVLEYDGTKYEELSKAQEIANAVNGKVVKVIDTEIHTRSYEEIKGE
ncbi:MAG: hypothetical protein ABS939_13715 [Psychrobacillus sp.]